MENFIVLSLFFGDKTAQFDAVRRRLTQSFFKNGRSRNGGNDRHLQLEDITHVCNSGVFLDLAKIFLWSCM